MIAFLLVLAFIVVPLVELAVIIEVGGHLGVVNTLGLLVLVSIGGAFLVRAQGLATVRRIRASIERGVVPGPDLVDGAAIIVAGALLLTPGFLTDAVGLLLLIPPTRALLRAVLRRAFLGRVAIRDVRFRRGTEPGPQQDTSRWAPPEELPPPS